MWSVASLLYKLLTPNPRYRAWFDGVAYAHSSDGVKWDKPNLGIWDADKWLLEDSGMPAFDMSKQLIYVSASVLKLTLDCLAV